MITRAYQNAKNERQEVTLSQAEWEALTIPQLEAMLGFGAPAPEPAPVRKPRTRKRK